MSTDNPYVTNKSKDRLNPRQLVDYNDFCRRLRTWLENHGKNPERERGLAEGTTRNYASRLDKFLRWVWTQENRYTTRVTHDHADRYVRALDTDKLRKKNGEPYSETHKRKEKDAIEKFFLWRKLEHGEDEWESPVDFRDEHSNPPDLLTRDELPKLREAVLEYQSIPNYKGLSPEERDRWKAHLAQVFGKKKSRVTPDDWDRVNLSWKFPSLIWTSLDAVLRPIEVERSNLSWLRLDKGTLYIPREESSKNHDNWETALRRRTVKALELWLEERSNYPKYDDSDAIWLNQRGNPYNTATLNKHLRKILELTDIDLENRHITWYSLRHSIGTYMTSEGDLAQTKEQLRHKSLETTMQYSHPPVDERRDTLDKID